MKKWQKILATAGVVATLGASLGTGLTGCTIRIKTGEDASHKYLILKQSDRNYTLHYVQSHTTNEYNTKCGLPVVYDSFSRVWMLSKKEEEFEGYEYIDAIFLCKDETAVEKAGYEAVCSKCFPDGYEQE